MEFINLFGFKKMSAFLLALPTILVLAFIVGNTVVTFVRQMSARTIVLGEYFVPKQQRLSNLYLVCLSVGTIGSFLCFISTHGCQGYEDRYEHCYGDYGPYSWWANGFYLQHWLQVCSVFLWPIIALAVIAGVGWSIWWILLRPFYRYILTPIGNGISNFCKSFTVSWK